MLQVRQIECTRGTRRLFHDLSFRLESRQALRIGGENGSGKSSLLRMVAGLSPVETGAILWNGARIAELGEAYRRDILFIGHSNALKDDLSAVENLRFALGLAGTVVADERIERALGDLGLAPVARLPVRLLSQGQKRRAALGRLAFSAGKALWILDEPFAALDAASVQGVAAVIAGHAAVGGLVLFTTHQDAEFPGVPVQSMELGESA